MSECEKAKIIGYTEQSPEQIAAINALKQLEIDVIAKCVEIFSTLPVQLNKSNPRWHAIGKTHVEQGFMALVRSVARPTE